MEFKKKKKKKKKKKHLKTLSIFKINSIHFIFICRASRNCSRSLLILCIIVMFSTRIFRNLGSAQDNFGKFIHQLQPETKTLIRELERILIKLYRQNVSYLIKHERLLPNYTHTGRFLV